MVHRSNVDTSSPFSSVKDAVALFGERLSAQQVHSLKPLSPLLPNPRKAGKESSWKYSSPNPMVSACSCNKLEDTVKRLEIKLEETNVELKLLKEREIEAEVALASLNAELHKSMSKIAQAEGAMAGAASSRLTSEIRAEDVDDGDDVKREEEKRIKSNSSLTFARTNFGVGEKEERSFVGMKRERVKLTKRKPIIPLIGDMLFRKKGSSSPLRVPSYASSYMYWDY